MADHSIELTEEGKKQARAAGTALAKYFAENLVEGYTKTGPFSDTKMTVPKIRLWYSPYMRTYQTQEELASTCVFPDLSKLTKDVGSGSHYWHRVVPGTAGGVKHEFPKPGDSWFIDRRFDTLLHEQQFGIFDGMSDEQRKTEYPAESAYYEKCKAHGGRSWAKLPMGESRMDVVHRMRGLFGTFHRDAEKHGIENLVIVGHGTTNRAFTMAWLHLPPDWLEAEPNPRNCSIRLIENNEDKGYIFEGFESPDGYKQGPNPESQE